MRLGFAWDCEVWSCSSSCGIATRGTYLLRRFGWGSVLISSADHLRRKAAGDSSYRAVLNPTCRADARGIRDGAATFPLSDLSIGNIQHGIGRWRVYLRGGGGGWVSSRQKPSSVKPLITMVFPPQINNRPLVYYRVMVYLA